MKKILTIIGLAAASLAGLQATVLLNEPFTYSNGALATVSSGVWTEISGTGGQNVVGNLLSIDDNSSGDDSRPLSSSVTSGTVFIGFDLVSLSSDQPSSTGTTGYFFGLNGGTYFNRLVMYRPTGSTAGKYTLGIAADNLSTNTNWGTELNQDTSYRIVMSYNLTSGLSTLWVDPTTISSTNVTSAAGGTPASSIIDAAFRISATSNGDKTVDNLIIATSFSEAVPEPKTWLLIGIGSSFMLWNMRRRRRFNS